MKKILIILAVLSATVACNAAAVEWSSGTVYKATDITTKVGNGVTDYLVTISFFSDAAGKNVLTGLSGDLSASTSKSPSRYSGTVDGFEGGKQYYVQMIITTDGYEAKSSIASFTVISTGNTSLNFAAGNGFDSSFSFNTGVEGTWQAIPEPTSGLLVLLGAAVLALKRKRA